MNLQRVARAYESLLRGRFSELTVCQGYLREDDPSDPFLRVRCIPDGRIEEFMNFSIDVLPDLVDEAGLPDVTIVPFGLEDSLRHFPEVVEGRAVPFASCVWGAQTLDLESTWLSLWVWANLTTSFEARAQDRPEAEASHARRPPYDDLALAA